MWPSFVFKKISLLQITNYLIISENMLMDEAFIHITSLLYKRTFSFNGSKTLKGLKIIIKFC